MIRCTFWTEHLQLPTNTEYNLGTAFIVEDYPKIVPVPALASAPKPISASSVRSWHPEKETCSKLYVRLARWIDVSKFKLDGVHDAFMHLGRPYHWPIEQSLMS